jgi:hypothetical protein
MATPGPHPQKLVADPLVGPECKFVSRILVSRILVSTVFVSRILVCFQDTCFQDTYLFRGYT